MSGPISAPKALFPAPLPGQVSIGLHYTFPSQIYILLVWIGSMSGMNIISRD